MAGGGVKVKISEEGARQLEQKIARIDRQMDKLSKDSARTGKALKSAMGSIKGTIAGMGLGGLVKDHMEFTKVLGYVQVRAGKSNQEMARMNEEIMHASNYSGIAKEQFAAAAKQLQDNGGWTDVLNGRYNKLGAIMRTTGVDATQLANALAALKKSGQGDEAAFRALEMGTVAADLGTVSEWQSAVGNLLPALESMNVSGERALLNFNQAIQVIGASVNGNVGEAKTAFNSLLNELSRKNIKGIKVYDKSGSMRDIDAIMGDLYKKTGGSAKRINKIFGENAAMAAKAYMVSIKQGDKGLAARIRTRLESKTESPEAQFQGMLKGISGPAIQAEKKLQWMNNAIDESARAFTQLFPNVSALTSALSQNTAASLIAYDAAKHMGSAMGGALKLARGKGGLLSFMAGSGGVLGKLGTSLSASSAGAIAGGVAIAGALGYGAGKLLDEWLGISNKIGNLGASEGRKADFRKKLDDNAKALEMANARAAVEKFSTMRNRGVTQLGEQQLTAHTAAVVAAKQQGITDPKVIQLLEKIAEQKMVVEVKQSGVDRITANGKRQRQ